MDDFTSINLDLLLLLVKEKAVLWNPMLPDYKNKQARLSAWSSIATDLFPHYRDCPDTEKKEERARVIFSWRSMLFTFKARDPSFRWIARAVPPRYCTDLAIAFPLRAEAGNSLLKPMMADWKKHGRQPKNTMDLDTSFFLAMKEKFKNVPAAQQIQCMIQILYILDYYSNDKLPPTNEHFQLFGGGVGYGNQFNELDDICMQHVMYYGCPPRRR